MGMYRSVRAILFFLSLTQSLGYSQISNSGNGANAVDSTVDYADLVMADVLIGAPITAQEVEPMAERWNSLRRAIHKLAIDRELMDKREETQYFLNVENFQSDLEFLRKRRYDLEDAPSLVDVHTLPPRGVVNELIKFNRAYRAELEEKLKWESDRADVIDEAIKETDGLYQKWEKIRDARCDFYLVPVRRLALKALREAIGVKAYERKEMPPYVPFWRFNNG